jgi:hypothetical protein
LRAQRCETFLDAVALKVTLAAQTKESRQAHVARDDKMLPARRADPQKASARIGHASATNRRPSEQAHARIGFALRVSGGVGVGTLPGVMGAFELAAAARLRRVSIELGVRAGLPRTEVYPGPPSAGVELQLITASPRLCVALLEGPLEVPLCAAGEVGLTRARSIGVPRAAPHDRLWAALGLALGVRVPVAGELWVLAEVQALVALTRASYRVLGMLPLYASDPFAGRAMLGLELQF